MLVLILFAGVYLSISTGFLQLRRLPSALKHLAGCMRAKKARRGGTSAYGALCTALGATVGTGNLAGVAGAIALGGPGAVFWMWVSGILGMIVKFAEVLLALRYRQRSKNGDWLAGPMYTICNGLPKKLHWLANLYCFFGVAAVFGIGNTAQVHTLLSSVSAAIAPYSLHPHTIRLTIGIGLSVLIFYSFRNGAKRIVAISEKIVPIAAGVYIMLSMAVLIARYPAIPAAMQEIITGAFSPGAVTGGVVGSAFISLRVGVSRGTFTNEAGMGTASIIHGEADTDDLIRQGFLGMVEVFLDTLVICTLTALVILCSGIPVSFGTDPGIQLTLDAFGTVCGEWSRGCLSLVTALLAFATILGWGLYGARCAQFLFGDSVWKLYPLLQSVATLAGVFLDTSAVWLISELFNGLMAIPNMIAILCLLPVVNEMIRAYRS